MTDTTPPYPVQGQDGPRRTPFLRLLAAVADRWPTCLGAALAVALLVGGGQESSGTLIVAVAALSYLTAAALDRPGAVWPAVAVLFAVGKASESLGIDYWFVLGPIALLAAVAGFVRGPLRRPGLFRLQVPQMLAVGAVVLLAEYGGLESAGYLVAAVLIGHAIWDIAHWRAGEVVSRSLAEFCAVLDSLLGLGIIIILLQV